MKKLDPHERSRKLHAEAQRRYKARLVKRGVPTHEVAMKALGEAFGAVAYSGEQIVNTDSKTLFRQILSETLSILINAGYNDEQSRKRLIKSFRELSLEYVAKQAARGATGDSDSDTDSDSYVPGA